jgi:hypothetical protein
MANHPQRFPNSPQSISNARSQVGEQMGGDYDDDIDPEAAGIFHRCTIRHVAEK